MDEEKKYAHTDFICPECGGPMHFDPESQKLKCDYCMSTIDINPVSSSEEFYLDKVEEQGTVWSLDKQVYKCKNCGSESVVSVKQMSFTCPFCNSNKTMKLDDLPGLKPNRVVPFKITQNAAKESFMMKLKKNIFVSKKVKKSDFDFNIKGVYLPSWTYDADTHSVYDGVLGKEHTVRNGKESRTEVEWFKVSGKIDLTFDDILVLSSESLDKKTFDKTQPYSTNQSFCYDEKFVAGYYTEHYTKTVQDGYKEAKQTMSNVIRQKILARYHYDRVQYLNVHSDFNDVMYKYVMLPIYRGNYTSNNKPYNFTVNGETGKATGKMPLSALRISIAVLLGILIIVGFIYLQAKYGN